ncbi:MAG: hypothetical protein ACXVJD_08280 [Mucilaginibacter sp.]
MKKFILSAAVVIAAGLSAVKANTLVTSTPAVAIIHQADSLQKTPIQLNALPEPVKTVLQTEVFKTWVPTTAYDVKAGNTQYYEVDVKKDTETKALKFDKDGKIIQ